MSDPIESSGSSPEISSIEILVDEIEPLFRACQRESAENQRRFSEQNPDLIYLVVPTPATPGEAGFKVEIFANEHPPPHFRVTYQGKNANFCIAKCERLNGNLPLRDRDIKNWWREHRLAIAAAWNTHRPTDCTVGPVNTDELGWTG